MVGFSNVASILTCLEGFRPGGVLRSGSDETGGWPGWGLRARRGLRRGDAGTLEAMGNVRVRLYSERVRDGSRVPLEVLMAARNIRLV
jgi:hypothetical protein